MPLLKTFAFLALVPGTVLFYIPLLIVKSGRSWLALETPWRSMAVLAWLPGMALMLWSMWDFASRGRGTPAPIDPPQELVVQGPYRYTRNPMYVGALLIVAGHFLWTGVLWLLVYAGGLFFAFHLFVVLYEEPALVRSFGAAYVRYREQTPRWLR